MEKGEWEVPGQGPEQGLSEGTPTQPGPPPAPRPQGKGSFSDTPTASRERQGLSRQHRTDPRLLSVPPWGQVGRCVIEGLARALPQTRRTPKRQDVRRPLGPAKEGRGDGLLGSDPAPHASQGVL